MFLFYKNSLRILRWITTYTKSMVTLIQITPYTTILYRESLSEKQITKLSPSAFSIKTSITRSQLYNFKISQRQDNVNFIWRDFCVIALYQNSDTSVCSSTKIFNHWTAKWVSRTPSISFLIETMELLDLSIHSL